MGLSLALVSSIQRKKKYSKGMMRRGRRRRRQRGEDLVAPEIPLDLQIEILSRLPGNSLMRFKCLSKLWSSLICSRNFSNGYLTVASPRRPPRLFISLVDHPKCGSMEACDDPRKSVLLSLSSSSSDSGKSFDQDLTMPGMGGHNMVVLRGLILYIVCGNACICNPTTRQSVTLPTLKSNIFVQKDLEKSVLYFLGHNPVLDQYKVVCTAVSSSTDLDTIISEHWVFVLEVGGSWKRVEFDQPHTPTRPGLCIRGVIYYLAFTSSMSTDIIVSFDVRSEELNIIQAPLTLSAFFGSVGFIEYGGKPAIIDHTSLVPMGLVDLWVLEDAGNWSKKSLCLQPSQMHLVSNNIELTVEGTTQNGEVILAPCELCSPFYILYYDLQKNDLSKVQVRGIPDNAFSSSYFCFKLMDNSESIIHLKT